MFEIATRHKLRLQSVRGALSVEMLWDVPLRSADGFNLDAVAQAANAALEQSARKSFVNDSVADAMASVPLDIIKHVIKVKLAEEATLKNAAANRLERQKLLRILAEKQDGELTELSVAELQERIQALGS